MVGFVNAVSYEKKEFWTAEGCKWMKFCQAKHPTFWVCQDSCKSRCGAALAGYLHCQPSKRAETNNSTTHNGMQSNGASNGAIMHSNGTGNGVTHDIYHYHAMYDVIDMPWDWLVDVNYHEAKAFCKWKGLVTYIRTYITGICWACSLSAR